MVNIKQGNIFGRIGSGIAQGLGEQIPKEIERNRFVSGLQNLEKQATEENLNPMQYFNRALQTYGLADKPQVVQSLSNLAQTQARVNAFDKENKPLPNPFTSTESQNQNENTNPYPSLTQSSNLEDIQKGFQALNEDQEWKEAGNRYNKNPARFANNPENALESVRRDELKRKAAYDQALIQHGNLDKIQTNVIDKLSDRNKRLGANIPGTLYNSIEEKATRAVLPKNRGGEGLTEFQAAQKYGKKMDEASKDYTSLKDIGSLAMFQRKPEANLRSIKSLQNSFKERDDTENMAKTLIANQKFSPYLAYATAQPVYQVPNLAGHIKSLPRLEPYHATAETIYDLENYGENVYPEIAEYLTNYDNASPLAIAYALRSKGYDSNKWLEYVTDHIDELNLRQNQINQLSSTENFISPLSDWWFSSFTGLD
jgi:hypothetical protein